MSLFPTKTRLALLRAVANGQVHTDWTVDEFRAVLFPDAPTSWQDASTVTARVLEVEREGWIEERGSTGEWRLSEEGLRILAGGGAQ